MTCPFFLKKGGRNEIFEMNEKNSYRMSVMGESMPPMSGCSGQGEGGVRWWRPRVGPRGRDVAEETEQWT